LVPGGVDSDIAGSADDFRPAFQIVRLKPRNSVACTGGRSGRYAFEAPDTHPVTKVYWAAARKIMDLGAVLTKAEYRIAAESNQPDDTASMEDEENEEKEEAAA
jgi:hypothetical protein